MLRESETLDRGHAVVCIFRACHNFLGEDAQMCVDDRSSDPFSIDKDGEPDPVCWITVGEIGGPIQSDVEFGVRNGLNECRRAQVIVLRSVLSERRAIDANGDESTREAVGVHLENRDAAMVLVLVFVR